MMCVSKEDAAMSIFVEQPSHCYPSHRVLCPSRRQYEVAMQSRLAIIHTSGSPPSPEKV